LTHWIALSDQTDLPVSAVQGDLDRGVLVVEIEMPLAGAGVLLDCRHEGATPDDVVALSLFHDLGAGIALLHRRGGRMMRHVLPGPLIQRVGTARLSFAWDCAAGRWTLDLELAGEKIGVRGDVVMPMPMVQLQALCQGGAGVQRHPSVLWHGVAEGAGLPRPMAWLGTATPILTARGTVAAGALRPGDRMITRDNGTVPLIGVTRVQVPGRGSLAPVRLRTPFYGRRGDMLVSPDQTIWISGPEAEYLFGEEEVLVLARHLADGEMALTDNRRAVAQGVVLDLGTSELIEADGCLLATPAADGTAPARRVLDSFEALPLRAMLARTQRHAV
jgi:hypothetical protein